MKQTLLVSVGKIGDKRFLLTILKKLSAYTDVIIYATNKTHRFLKENSVMSLLIFKISEIGKTPNIADFLPEKMFDIIINIPTRITIREGSEYTDGKLIRKTAVSLGIPLVTDPEVAVMTIEKIIKKQDENK